MEEFELIAKTFQGLEEVLAQELTELGANNVQIGRRMVSFTGDKRMMYRANFCLRTAVRVLKPIVHFKARTADEVYAVVRGLDWSKYLDVHTSFAVDSVIYSDDFRHSKFVAYKVKDAIVDYFREEQGERPSIRVTNPDLKLNIHISEDDCTLSLDSSGESLHLRGYRVATVEAPINEVLAAGLIKLTGWRADCDFIDPFCGSGTFLVEAALMARNIYPGVFRKRFGFEKWKDFDGEMLDEIFNDDSQERDFPYRIYGYDINFRAVEAAQANVKSAGVSAFVEVKQQDVRNFSKPPRRALMVTNPPYGARLTSPDLLALYHDFGLRLKKEFAGNEAWVISSKEELFEHLGLRASFKIQVLNSSIDCDFRKYLLFEGKLNAFRAEGGTVKTDEERRLMGDHRRFRTNREEFKQREGDEKPGEGEEFDKEYMILSQRHKLFMSSKLNPERKRPEGRGGFGAKKGGSRFGEKGEGFSKGGKFVGSRDGRSGGSRGGKNAGGASKKGFRGNTRRGGGSSDGGRGRSDGSE